MQPNTAVPESEEHTQHLSAIQSISEQHHLPAADVATLYERELASIRQDALITNYLSIFVSRRVNQLLRDSGLPPSAAASADAAVQ